YSGGYEWPMLPESTARYYLTVTNGACVETSDIVVIVNPLPEFTVSQSAPEEATLVQISTGAEPYDYYLDGGSVRMEELVFDVKPGEHYVTAIDVNACEAVVTFEIDKSKVPLIIPSFFTPDGDGVNDVWEIGNIGRYPSAIVKIYDRFSKLVAEFRGAETSWDGTYNGHQCVSTDYWYYIDIPELGKPISGHVTLFRGRKD
ncbi:MAG: T9SS type B sorting domain-containing protein, partial [Paludibacteraceae bacterium]|nr:T9SS type B sorting domain-containing protein [Paludibacteraceae bacterium]